MNFFFVNKKEVNLNCVMEKKSYVLYFFIVVASLLIFVEQGGEEKQKQIDHTYVKINLRDAGNQEDHE